MQIPASDIVKRSDISEDLAERHVCKVPDSCIHGERFQCGAKALGTGCGAHFVNDRGKWREFTKREYRQMIYAPMGTYRPV